MHRKTSLLLVSAIIICAIMYSMEAIFEATYLVKFFIRIILFVGAPLIFFWKDMFRWIRSNSWKSSVWWWIGTIIVMLMIYFLIQDQIDMNQVQDQLTRIGITKKVYVLSSTYIVFGNSFLEEYFFRGFLTLWLMKYGMKNWHAITLSGTLFSLYHIALFWSWFSTSLNIVLLVGLFFSGIFLSTIAVKTRGYLTSWIIHICADTVIVLIGAQMFL